ncbi:hypothetical protein ACFL6C_02455, partial [Myxococcota bacterium]
MKEMNLLMQQARQALVEGRQGDFEELQEKREEAAKRNDLTGLEPAPLQKLRQAPHLAPTTRLPTNEPTLASTVIPIDRLWRQSGEISGDALLQAIREGIADPDQQEAGREYEAFMQFADANWSRLSPAARQLIQEYTDTVREHRMAGRAGLDPAATAKMLG